MRIIIKYIRHLVIFGSRASNVEQENPTRCLQLQPRGVQESIPLPLPVIPPASIFLIILPGSVVYQSGFCQGNRLHWNCGRLRTSANFILEKMVTNTGVAAHNRTVASRPLTRCILIPTAFDQHIPPLRYPSTSLSPEIIRTTTPTPQPYAGGGGRRPEANAEVLYRGFFQPCHSGELQG